MLLGLEPALPTGACALRMLLDVETNGPSFLRMREFVERQAQLLLPGPPSTLPSSSAITSVDPGGSAEGLLHNCRCRRNALCCFRPLSCGVAPYVATGNWLDTQAVLNISQVKDLPPQPTVDPKKMNPLIPQAASFLLVPVMSRCTWLSSFLLRPASAMAHQYPPSSFQSLSKALLYSEPIK